MKYAYTHSSPLGSISKFKKENMSFSEKIRNGLLHKTHILYMFLRVNILLVKHYDNAPKN